MVSVPARRSQVALATGRGLSQRRACTLVKVGRSALRYRSRMAEKDAAVLARMTSLAAQYPGYGCRASSARAALRFTCVPTTAPSSSRAPTADLDPGKPWQNGATESFNGKFRDECLSLEWFRSRAEAKVVIESWRRHFNEVRPHSSLGYLTPAEFVVKIEEDAAVAAGNGSDRCGMWSLCAPTRCITVPQGASEGSTEGAVLKLGVARRNWAGQSGCEHRLPRNGNVFAADRLAGQLPTGAKMHVIVGAWLMTSAGPRQICHLVSREGRRVSSLPIRTV
jgi:Integrase core domain